MRTPDGLPGIGREPSFRAAECAVAHQVVAEGAVADRRGRTEEEA